MDNRRSPFDPPHADHVGVEINLGALMAPFFVSRAPPRPLVRALRAPPAGLGGAAIYRVRVTAGPCAAEVEGPDAARVLLMTGAIVVGAHVGGSVLAQRAAGGIAVALAAPLLRRLVAALVRRPRALRA